VAQRIDAPTTLESTMDKIPNGAWIVVADGTRARILCNVGKDSHVSLTQQQLVEPANLDDDGPAGRQPPETSAEEIDEATFAKQLAHRLNAAALKNEFAHLVLIADHQFPADHGPVLPAGDRHRIGRDLQRRRLDPHQPPRRLRRGCTHREVARRQ